jgi:hypothetical protein
MRKLILATLAVAASITGASAADAQYYGGGGGGYGYGRGDGICRREASRAWNRREADRIYRRCIHDVRRAERDRERAMLHRNRGW